jgi:serine/threonine protein phosphatase PrpC
VPAQLPVVASDRRLAHPVALSAVDPFVAGQLHVGDSRGYLLAAGASGLVRSTRDDTFVQRLVDTGALTAEEARGHPRRSLTTQAVKGEPYRPSVATVPVEAGDRVLLCSDGLSDYVDGRHAIGEVLRTESDPRPAPATSSRSHSRCRRTTT